MHTATHTIVYRHTNQIIKEIIMQTTKHKMPKLLPHTQNKYRPLGPHSMEKGIDSDSPADS